MDKRKGVAYLLAVIALSFCTMIAAGVGLWLSVHDNDLMAIPVSEGMSIEATRKWLTDSGLPADTAETVARSIKSSNDLSEQARRYCSYGADQIQWILIAIALLAAAIAGLTITLAAVASKTAA